MTPNYPSPAELKSCRRGAEWAAAAAAAVDVGIFDALAGGGRSLDGLSETLGLDRRALQIVLEVLEALTLVRLDAGRVHLTEEGRRRYVETTPGNSEALAARRWRDSMREWLYLDRVLRGGTPPGPNSGPGALARRKRDAELAEGAAPGAAAADEPLDRFMAAMAGKPSEQVERVVDVCLDRHPQARSVLDLGGGPGVHSRAFVRRGLHATLFDTPETVDYVSEAYGLKAEKRIELVRGDFLETLPTALYDIVLLSNITHIYSAATNASLIARLAGLQKPGGVIAIMDFIRGFSPFAPLFAVTMLLKTEAGDTYSLDDYRQWLENAGYRGVEIELVDEDRQLITALLA